MHATDSCNHAGLRPLGGAEVVSGVPTPSIGVDKLLVRVHATGVTPFDWEIRDGVKAIEPVRFRLILGQDAAGIIAQAGPSVTRFAVGGAVYDNSGV